MSPTPTASVWALTVTGKSHTGSGCDKHPRHVLLGLVNGWVPWGAREAGLGAKLYLGFTWERPPLRKSLSL